MSIRYPGGLVRKTPPTITPPVGGEGGSAPGVWTLEQASYYTKTGVWPLPTLPRSLYTWGTGLYGQTGQNDEISRSSPVQVGALTDWNYITSAYSSSAAIKTDGTLWMWGLGSSGQLALNDQTNRSSPTQIGALTNWAKITGGADAYWAIKTDGTLWSWGNNFGGGLAQGQSGQDLPGLSSPTQVGAETNWSDVAQTGSGFVALKTNGTLWAAGANNAGQLGQGNSVYRSSLVQIGALTTWSKISGGSQYFVATRTNGTLWTCGLNGNGQLGDGTTENKSSPVQIGALTNWSSPGSLLERTAFAIKTDGTLWAWGSSGWGQLGLGNTNDRSSPVQVGALTTWLRVGGGQYFTLATKTDGTLWAWGRNNAGQLGIGTVAHQSSPVQVGANTKWNLIAGTNNSAMATTKG